MWAVYVDDPIGFMHLICECRNLKDATSCVYQWAKLSTFWKQWKLDYPEHNLLWSIYKTNERNMPEIMHQDTGIHENPGAGVAETKDFSPWRSVPRCYLFRPISGQ